MLFGLTTYRGLPQLLTGLGVNHQLEQRKTTRQGLLQGSAFSGAGMASALEKIYRGFMAKVLILTESVVRERPSIISVEGLTR